jgi:hypothetical protein
MSPEAKAALVRALQQCIDSFNHAATELMQPGPGPVPESAIDSIYADVKRLQVMRDRIRKSD